MPAYKVRARKRMQQALGVAGFTQGDIEELTKHIQKLTRLHLDVYRPAKIQNYELSKIKKEVCGLHPRLSTPENEATLRLVMSYSRSHFSDIRCKPNQRMRKNLEILKMMERPRAENRQTPNVANAAQQSSPNLHIEDCSDRPLQVLTSTTEELPSRIPTIKPNTVSNEVQIIGEPYKKWRTRTGIFADEGLFAGHKYDARLEFDDEDDVCEDCRLYSNHNPNARSIPKNLTKTELSPLNQG